MNNYIKILPALFVMAGYNIDHCDAMQRGNGLQESNPNKIVNEMNEEQQQLIEDIRQKWQVIQSKASQYIDQLQKAVVLKTTDFVTNLKIMFEQLATSYINITENNNLHQQITMENIKQEASVYRTMLYMISQQLSDFRDGLQKELDIMENLKRKESNEVPQKTNSHDGIEYLDLAKHQNLSRKTELEMQIYLLNYRIDDFQQKIVENFEQFMKDYNLHN